MSDDEVQSKQSVESQKSIADNQDWSYYFNPRKMTVLLSKSKWRWIPNSILVGFYYLFQVSGCIAAVNFYGDIDRFTKCDLNSD